MVVALTTVNREPGQDLSGAAISGVALCEGRLQRASRLLEVGVRSAASPFSDRSVRALRQGTTRTAFRKDRPAHRAAAA